MKDKGALRPKLFCPFCGKTAFAAQYWYECTACKALSFIARSSDVKSCSENLSKATEDGKMCRLDVSVTIDLPSARVNMLLPKLPPPVTGRGRAQDL